MARAATAGGMPLSVALEYFRQDQLAALLGLAQGRISQVKRNNPDATIRIWEDGRVELVMLHVVGSRSGKAGKGGAARE